MRRVWITLGARVVLLACALTVAACSTTQQVPTAPMVVTAAAATATVLQPTEAGPPWGPETPNFNLEAVLHGQGFGLVKFRQPNDDRLIINLDVWVRDLEPNTAYSLQRAVDTIPDGACTSTAWLTLGKGLTPQSIITDDRGIGREDLFRDVSGFPVGKTFDIHFRVIKNASAEVALTSGCYQFAISQ